MSIYNVRWDEERTAPRDFIMLYNQTFLVPVVDKDSGEIFVEDDITFKQNESKPVTYKQKRAKRRKVNMRMKRRKCEKPSEQLERLIQKRGNKAVRQDSNRLQNQALHTYESEYDTIEVWKAVEIARNKLATVTLPTAVWRG